MKTSEIQAAIEAAEAAQKRVHVFTNQRVDGTLIELHEKRRGVGAEVLLKSAKGITHAIPVVQVTHVELRERPQSMAPPIAVGDVVYYVRSPDAFVVPFLRLGRTVVTKVAPATFYIDALPTERILHELHVDKGAQTAFEREPHYLSRHGRRFHPATPALGAYYARGEARAELAARFDRVSLRLAAAGGGSGMITHGLLERQLLTNEGAAWLEELVALLERAPPVKAVR